MDGSSPGTELLRAARGGSEDAGRRLMSEHGPSMVRTAWSVLGRYGASEADDVVQEAFVAALTTRALPRGDLGAWLRAITARKALDAVRRLRRHGDEAMPDPPADTRAPIDRLVVREALGRLSATDRAVLVLVHVEGFSMKETARALRLTRIAVRLRAVRARRKLARLLASRE